MKKRSGGGCHIVLAELLLQVGATKLAESVLNKALAIAIRAQDFGWLAHVYSVQAIIEERKGDQARAQRLLQQAVEVSPPDDLGMHHMFLAFFHKKHHDYGRAAIHFEKALQSWAADDEEYRASIEAELRECREKASR
jgi:Tfp pilus assembly protein PilF